MQSLVKWFEISISVVGIAMVYVAMLLLVYYAIKYTIRVKVKRNEEYLDEKYRHRNRQ